MKHKALKKISLALILFLSLGQTIQAQNPKSSRTDAALSYRSFQENPSQIVELKRAKENIDLAAGHEKMQDDGQTFRLKARIYADLALTEAGLAEYPDAGVQAYEAAIKALEIEEAAIEKKGKPLSKIAAQNEFREIFPQVGFALYNAGVDAYQSKKYRNAYENFARILQIRSRCAAFTEGKQALNFKRGSFELKESEVLPLCIQAGLSWGLEAKSAEALGLVEKIIQEKKSLLSDKDGGNLYARLSVAYNEIGKISEAKRVLGEARKAYPASLDLLISQINMAASEGKLAEVENELQAAVKADPTNAELTFALGGVYYQLMSDAIEKADGKADPQIKTQLEKALAWYAKTQEVKRDHFGAIFNSGVCFILYSNYLINQMSELKTNSPEYTQLSKESDSFFDRGVAKLHEAEGLEPNDLMLLNALKEVYGKKNDAAKFGEYKQRFENQQAKKRGN